MDTTNATEDQNGISRQAEMLSNLAYSNIVESMNLTMQNAVSNQQAMNELGISVIAKCAGLVTSHGAIEK